MTTIEQTTLVVVPAHPYSPLWVVDRDDATIRDDAGICGHSHYYADDLSTVWCGKPENDAVHHGADRRVVVDEWDRIEEKP